MAPKPHDVFCAYRSHYEGPLSKRVVQLPGSSVLEWFQSTWSDALWLPEPEGAFEFTKERVGMGIYGLSSIFETAREQRLPAPGSWGELVQALQKHLYVEGEIRAADGRLSIQTDDDEVELAYFFFTRQWAEAHPERTAYLLHDDWKLPADPGQTAFAPDFDVRPVARGSGEGTVYLQFMGFDDSESLGGLDWMGGLVAIPGLRLPELPDFLRRAEVTEDPKWPSRLEVLRACTPTEPANALEVALRAADRVEPGAMYGREEGGWAQVHAAMSSNPPSANGGDPAKTLMVVTDHFAQLCSHATDWAGYQQWFLYDDLWAGAHPDLARSLMRYGRSWDPLT